MLDPQDTHTPQKFDSALDPVKNAGSVMESSHARVNEDLPDPEMSREMSLASTRTYVQWETFLRTPGLNEAAPASQALTNRTGSFKNVVRGRTGLSEQLNAAARPPARPLLQHLRESQTASRMTPPPNRPAA